MSTSFMQSPQSLFTSESVTEGHPDKLCDQISDAVLDAILKEDPEARVAAECLATTGLVIVAGEITTRTYVDMQKLVRQVLEEVGYTRGKYGFDAHTCAVMTSIKEQSPDIDMGVSKSLEAKTARSLDETYEQLGAGDQGMMIGFACDETPELMPLPIMLAHKICRQLAAVRKNRELPYLRPDGKSQVTVEYQFGRPVRVDTVVVSAQHDEKVTHAQIEREVIEWVIKPVLDEQAELLGLRTPSGASDVRLATRFLVNPTGRFVVGGPMGDAGLTGRKIIVDTYGGMARHGGGAFSGKDPTKVDRSAAYAARYVAKNVVAAGLARRFEVQLAYAIGVARPVSVMVETFGTHDSRVSPEIIREAILKHFDLRPAAIIEHLRLRRPIYRPTAAYGHFGRTDIDAPWEATDRADLLRRECGLKAAPLEAVG